MISALVTTYNEADTIGQLVSALHEVVDHVLVVDDARSTDNTEAVAAAFGAETLVDISITGIGPCLLVGMSRLRGHKVVTIDAGGSHDPYEIPAMTYSTTDVVVGSRFVPGGSYEGRAWRARASRFYSHLCSVKTGYDCKDWTSGFRCYSPAAVREILSRPPSATMHGFQPQALAVCYGSGIRVREHPIAYRAGRTSMNRKVAREAVWALGALRCS